MSACRCQECADIHTATVERLEAELAQERERNKYPYPKQDDNHPHEWVPVSACATCVQEQWRALAQAQAERDEAMAYRVRWADAEDAMAQVRQLREALEAISDVAPGKHGTETTAAYRVCGTCTWIISNARAALLATEGNTHSGD